jgi:hypothetical protein
LSLVYLKKKLYHEAEAMASKGLDAEWSHNQSSYRRAMARLKISLGTQGGGYPRIRGAIKDVINSNPGDATRKLLLQIEKEDVASIFVSNSPLLATFDTRDCSASCFHWDKLPLVKVPVFDDEGLYYLLPNILYYIYHYYQYNCIILA